MAQGKERRTDPTLEADDNLLPDHSIATVAARRSRHGRHRLSDRSRPCKHRSAAGHGSVRTPRRVRCRGCPEMRDMVRSRPRTRRLRAASSSFVSGADIALSSIRGRASEVVVLLLLLLLLVRVLRERTVLLMLRLVATERVRLDLVCSDSERPLRVTRAVRRRSASKQ